MEEIEGFMLKHGEKIIDSLGAEVDRIEKEIKVIIVLLFLLHVLMIITESFFIVDICRQLFIPGIFGMLLAWFPL